MPYCLYRLQFPEGSDRLVSGVYTLLASGSLPPSHPDHPAQRRKEGPDASATAFPALPLTAAGLPLASLYMETNGRCGNHNRSS